MITEESKQQIYKHILADVEELELPFPPELLGLILGKIIAQVEQFHSVDTARMMELKLAEIEEKYKKNAR